MNNIFTINTEEGAHIGTMQMQKNSPYFIELLITMIKEHYLFDNVTPSAGQDLNPNNYEGKNKTILFMCWTSDEGETAADANEVKIFIDSSYLYSHPKEKALFNSN